ncbi:MAG: hypothetical protein LUD72_13900 [Bacteroidales bacterium]|nr:hypothetical protein [Bacteroidales bacterium]
MQILREYRQISVPLKQFRKLTNVRAITSRDHAEELAKMSAGDAVKTGKGVIFAGSFENIV